MLSFHAHVLVFLPIQHFATQMEGWFQEKTVVPNELVKYTVGYTSDISEFNDLYPTIKLPVQ